MQQATPQIFIKNRQPRLVTLCAIMPPEREGLKPTRTDVQLGPGCGPISKAFWEEAKKVSVVESMIEDGLLEEMGPTSDGSLASLKQAEALAVINETYTPKLLGRWLLEARDAKIKAAIQKRIDEYEKATRPDEKKAEA